jgi:hypothetical protein
MIEPYATEKSGKLGRRIFYGWYMVAASVVANTIFSAAYFQGFGVLIIPIERTFGWDRWVVSAAMSMRQLESGIISPAVGFLLDRFSARKLIFWSAVISGAGFIGLGFTRHRHVFSLLRGHFRWSIRRQPRGYLARDHLALVSPQPRLGHGACGNRSDLRLAHRHTEHADRSGARLARCPVRLRHPGLGRRHAAQHVGARPAGALRFAA